MSLLKMWLMIWGKARHTVSEVIDTKDLSVIYCGETKILGIKQECK